MYMQVHVFRNIYLYPCVHITFTIVCAEKQKRRIFLNSEGLFFGWSLEISLLFWEWKGTSRGESLRVGKWVS